VLASCFLLSVNSYFYIQKSLLSSQLEGNNAEVMALLNDKQTIDKTNQAINVINTEFLRVQSTHALWNILHKAIESGMQVSRFKRDKQGVELRGLAEQSTKILSDLNELPEVIDATFQGSIRKSRGKDSFTIVLQVKPLRLESKKGVNREI
jgi:outer membrane receptor for ferrienterochelin and colicin